MIRESHYFLNFNFILNKIQPHIIEDLGIEHFLQMFSKYANLQQNVHPTFNGSATLKSLSANEIYVILRTIWFSCEKAFVMRKPALCVCLSVSIMTGAFL